jgi:hypothetical protein
MRRKADGRTLRKGAGFDMARLKRLPQKYETWETDFRALPKPMMQTQTHYVGLVVNKRNGSVLADKTIERKPSATDLAALLVKAMRQPLTGTAYRPAASISEVIESGRSFSRSWKNWASRLPSGRRFRR